VKRTLAAVFFLVLLIATLAGTRLSLLAKANFSMYPSYPVIHIESPTNSTHSVTILILNVTVTTLNNPYDHSDISQRITRRVSYSLDGKSQGTLSETSHSRENEIKEDVYLYFVSNFSAVLPELTDGPHNITVHAEYDYRRQGLKRESESTVYFTIATEIDAAPPFTTAAITSGVSVAIIGMGLLVYFKKRKQ